MVKMLQKENHRLTVSVNLKDKIIDSLSNQVAQLEGRLEEAQIGLELVDLLKRATRG